MSETAPDKLQTPSSPEIVAPTPENHAERPTPAKHENHEHAAKKRNSHELAAAARQEIAHTAPEKERAQEKLAAAAASTGPQHGTAANNPELRTATVNRELHRLQQRESAPERSFSKLIHQPAVRMVSEVAGKTVSRPSGMLGGGVVAFIGTSGYLYLAKHMGFTYNYMIVLILFCGGFLLGLGLELIIHAATRSRRPSDG